MSGPEQVHFDHYSAVCEEVHRLLPVELPAYITHARLREKLAILRVDMLWLLDKMNDDTHPYVSNKKGFSCVIIIHD